jgi:hypothetical protein
MGGVFVRHKPIIQVVLTANDRTILSQGLLDSGSDDTVFPRTSGEELGIMFDGLPKSVAAGVGGEAIEYAIAGVRLAIDDGTQCYEWPARVGFRLDGKKVLPLLGQAGFLQFFTVEFRGDTHEAVLTPKGTFPGVVS